MMVHSILQRNCNLYWMTGLHVYMYITLRKENRDTADKVQYFIHFRSINVTQHHLNEYNDRNVCCSE